MKRCSSPTHISDTTKKGVRDVTAIPGYDAFSASTSRKSRVRSPFSFMGLPSVLAELRWKLRELRGEIGRVRCVLLAE